jgi:hypothetical protein
VTYSLLVAWVDADGHAWTSLVPDLNAAVALVGGREFHSDPSMPGRYLTADRKASATAVSVELLRAPLVLVSAA